jgi:hypothetical protein
MFLDFLVRSFVLQVSQARTTSLPAFYRPRITAGEGAAVVGGPWIRTASVGSAKCPTFPRRFLHKDTVRPATALEEEANDDNSDGEVGDFSLEDIPEAAKDEETEVIEHRDSGTLWLSNVFPSQLGKFESLVKLWFFDMKYVESSTRKLIEQMANEYNIEILSVHIHDKEGGAGNNMYTFISAVLGACTWSHWPRIHRVPHRAAVPFVPPPPPTVARAANSNDV